jgi:hypothetical protein
MAASRLFSGSGSDSGDGVSDRTRGVDVGI